MSDTANRLKAYCRENNRVCPQPTLWHQLWEILPNRKQVGTGWQPSLPLILAAWHETSTQLKMLRLAEHIEWADKHNAMVPVAAFLRNLREEDWLHLGE